MSSSQNDLISRASKYGEKSKDVEQLIEHTLIVLNDLGIPLDGSPRRLQRMAMSFMAVSNIASMDDWNNIVERSQHHHLKTRDIIEFINEYFEEDISRGSYDDVRRRDLQLLLAANIVLHTQPSTATNNPSRAYMLSPIFAQIIQFFGTRDWELKLDEFLKNKVTLIQELATTREMDLLPVQIPSGGTLQFSPGKHNKLQKLVIELFLPRYGYGAEVLYVGDTSDKFLLLEAERLKQLQFFELSHGKLPDIVAYSSHKNWLYLIEAVHSSGAITPLRLRDLQRLTQQCTAEIIYVTTFLNRETFRKFVADIAWETEVWIADDPDHLIHFDGEKFLGPYK